MIGLVDFLIASEVDFDVKKTKVHLACWNGQEEPINVYYEGRFKAWQEWQSRRNFSCSHVLSLIDLGNREWLFAGVYEVLECNPHPEVDGHYRYKTREASKQKGLIGRIITRHRRTRQSYIWYKPEIELPIVEIRREKMTIAEFPGYNAVCISHGELNVITRQKIASWLSALGNIKGIYLITDTYTGCHYVGKASGSVGIWQRWCSYARNGHGGNKHLRQLIRENGDEYAKNFQFSILEIADTHASDLDILGRESYWMNALRTREFGLN